MEEGDALRQPSMPPDVDAAFTAALDNVAYDSLRVLTLWMPVVWVILLPFVVLTSAPHQAITFTLLQLTDVMILLAVRLGLRRGKIQTRSAPAVLAGVLALPIFDILVRGIIQYTADRLIFLELTTIGIGLFCLSARWLAVLLALALATGGFLIWRAPAAEVGLVQSVLPLVIAAGIAVVARMTRAGAVGHVEQVRRQDVRHLAEARASEAQFRGIVNGIHDVFYRTDLAGMVQMVSPSVQRFGYRYEDVIGSNVLQYYADPCQREAFVKEVTEKGYVADHELVMFRKDGTQVIVGASVNLLRDEKGQPIGFEGLLHDLSDRKVEETRKLREARETAALARVGRELIGSHDAPTLLRRLCQLTTEVFVCDVSHTWLFEGDEVFLAAGYGDMAERWESLRALRVPRSMVEPLIGILDRDGVAQFVMSQTEDQVMASVALKYGITLALYFPLRRGEKIMGFQGAACCGREEPYTPDEEHIAKGVAHLASLALENARLLEELERANRLKSDFVATMSHELRTPLNVLMGYHSLLREGDFGALTGDQSEVLKRMERNTRELGELISATLDLSRLEEGNMPVEVSDVDLAGLLAELSAETDTLGEKPGVRFVVESEPGLLPVRTDRLKLKVVLKNLVVNALKFTENGTVTLRACTAREGVELSVADTGTGIAPEILPFIFDPFRQGDSSMTRSHGGVGLGLYIVYRLLGMLGGTVDVESEPGQGAIFRVWIPRDQKVQ
jgi:PAS domain S-box-containing protein